MPVLTSGFEKGHDVAKWVLTDGTQPATIDKSAPLSGAQSLRCNPVASEGLIATQVATTVDKFGAGMWVYRFRVRFAALPTVDMNISNVVLGGAMFNAADSKIYAGSVGQYIGATGVSVAADVVYVIDARMDATTSEWLCDVSVNGEACGQASHTAPGPFASARKLSLGIWNPTVGGDADAVFDDVVLSVDPADYPIGF